jgi:hypothetical protein
MKNVLRGAVILGMIISGLALLDWYMITTASDIVNNCETFDSRGLMDSMPCSNRASVGGLEALDEHLTARINQIQRCSDDHEDYKGFRSCLSDKETSKKIVYSGSGKR